MACQESSGTKGYRFASLIYDQVIESGMSVIRQKTLEICGVEPGEKVLDVCCGTGSQAELFAEAGADVCGVELSRYMIAKAKNKEKKNLHFVQADAAATGLAESSFDISCSAFSLHEVDKDTRTAFLNEMIRVTKPDGCLVISDFAIQTRKTFRNRLRKRMAHTIEWIAGGEHYRNYKEWMREGGLPGFLSGKGIEVEKTIPLNGGYILIAKAVNFK